ncbi:hypothetical protein NPIL_395811 [Nephila pilipes]|uniref:Uncharacterized protein n=1 Tax=Nephila pilipes TaxID=299642 RepID=A0A8X6PVD1_NEPPI|nr:hypothetical protein NPIL_395811 [Nephila pilipes]
MSAAGNISSMLAIDAEDIDLKTMQMDISSHVSPLENRERPTSRGPCLSAGAFSTSKVLQPFLWDSLQLSFICDVSTDLIRPSVPQIFQREIF